MFVENSGMPSRLPSCRRNEKLAAAGGHTSVEGVQWGGGEAVEVGGGGCVTADQTGFWLR